MSSDVRPATDVTDEQIAEVRRLAAEATPGPWRCEDVFFTEAHRLGGVEVKDREGRDIANTDSLDNDFECEANAAYIAAANPAFMLAVLDQYRAERQAREAAEADSEYQRVRADALRRSLMAQLEARGAATVSDYPGDAYAALAWPAERPAGWVEEG